MVSIYLELILIAVCLALLFLLSLVEAAVIQSSPFVLRTFLERDKGPSTPLLPALLEDETQVMVPLRLGTQATLITTAILATHLSLLEWGSWGLAVAFALILLVSALVRQLMPGLLTQNDPERKLVRLLAVFAPLYRVLRSFAFPLSSVLNRYRKSDTGGDGAQAPPAGDATEEEIQAYLDIGEDEGIIEEEDSKLIQSVVEFGDALVREVMTPRTKIVACSAKASVAELRDIMVQNRHSRIPVFQEDLDHIAGIAYIRQLLAHFRPGHESDPITPLIHPALFVPETKRVPALLKELQARGDQAAIVIDEFGGVAGLVTMEDLLEEIVGEMRDEDQAEVNEIVEERGRSFVLRGSMELHRLEEILERKLEGGESSTVSGLVVGYLGRVPAPGEEFRMHGLQIRILDADRRRVHRISLQR